MGYQLVVAITIWNFTFASRNTKLGFTQYVDLAAALRLRHARREQVLTIDELSRYERCDPAALLRVEDLATFGIRVRWR